MKIVATILFTLGLIQSSFSQTLYSPSGTVGTSSNGNVGIGTSSPSFKLSVEGEVGIIKDYPYIQFNSTSWNSNSFIQTGVTTAAQANGDYMVFRNPDNKGFNFRQGSYNAFIIQPTGNIGIGTSTPIFKLSVEGEIGVIEDYPYIQFNSTSWNSNSFIQTGVTTAAQANGDYMVFRNPDNKGFNFRQGTNNAFTILPTGSIGIGTITTGSHKLAVEGSIGAREIKVEASGWSDFVFEGGYDLLTLEEVEQHINQNGNLPEIPSETEVTENGINLGEMNAKLLQKIEELTLYMIDMNKRMKQIETENTELKEKVQSIENQ